MEHILELAAIVFGAQGMWELLKLVYQNKKKKLTASEDAELAILHEMIYEKLEECILEGRVGIETFDRIDKLYQPYHRLGGNGTVERRYQMVYALPRYDDRKEGIDDEE